MTESELAVVREFVRRVNARALEIMQQTSRTEGAHYNAMVLELVRVEREAGAARTLEGRASD